MLKNVPFLELEDEDIFKVDLTPEMGDLVIVGDIMEKKYVCLKEEETLENAYKRLNLNLKDELPVIDASGKLVGMVGVFDIVLAVFRAQGVIQ